jgi:hypothetical protein
MSTQLLPSDGGPTRFLIRVEDADELRQRYLRSLTLGGLLIDTRDVLPIDREVVVEFEPPGGRAPLLLRGRVVRIELDQRSGESVPVAMEIKLVGLARDEELALAALLADFGDDTAAAGAEGAAPGDDAAVSLELQRLQAELDALRARAAELQAELDDLTEEDRHSRAVVERLDARRAELGAAAARAQSRLTNDLAALQTRHDELAETLRRQTDAALRTATEEVELAYVMQSRQADGLERQAAALADELERQVAERREQLDEVTAELAAMQELAAEIGSGPPPETAEVRAQLRAAERRQKDLLAEAAGAEADEQVQREQLASQLDTTRRLLAARQAKNAELTSAVDAAANRHARLLAKKQDLERLLGLLPTDPAQDVTQESAAGSGDPSAPAAAPCAPAPQSDDAEADGIDVDVGDEPAETS